MFPGRKYRLQGPRPDTKFGHFDSAVKISHRVSYTLQPTSIQPLTVHPCSTLTHEEVLDMSKINKHKDG